MNIFLVAGEASADIHAAKLVKELKEMRPDLSFFGIGGERVQREGMEIIYPSSSLNVMGIAEWADRFGELISIYRNTLKTVRRRGPDMAILLDLPDFNLKLAKKLKALGIPVVYYISPQVWAWRRYRVKKIRRCVDKMMVVFPFEEAFYQEHGVKVSFVGHPLGEIIPTRSKHRSHVEIVRSPKIAILPGSRVSEIRYHATLVREYVSSMRELFPGATFEVPVAPTLSVDQVKGTIGDLDAIQYTDRESFESLAQADLAVVASGTATLEAALVGTPFTLFYKVSRSSAWIFRHLIRYRGPIGMPNLLLPSPLVMELFQEAATSENLAKESTRQILDSEYRESLEKGLRDVRVGLKSSGASRRAANCVLEVAAMKVGGQNVERVPAYT